jgi:hypothetical protein
MELDKIIYYRNQLDVGTKFYKNCWLELYNVFGEQGKLEEIKLMASIEMKFKEETNDNSRKDS